MKFIVKLIIPLIVFCSCTDSFESTSDLDNNTNYQQTKDLAHLIYVAENAASILDHSSRGANRQVNFEGINVVSVSHGRASEDDTLLYTVNYADDKGFVIIGAPKGSPDIVGIVEEGSYTADLLSDNPAFAAYLEEVANEIQYSFGPINGDSVTQMNPINPGIPSATIIEIEEWDVHTQYGPYIELRWGQEGVEGSLCPNGTAGCVITAAAQLLAWYELPKGLKVTCPESPLSYVELDWEDMKMHYVDHNHSNVSYRNPLIDDEIHNHCEASENAHSNLALLCRQLGYGVGASYRKNGTGSNPRAMLSYIVSTYPYSFKNHFTTEGTKSLISVLKERPCMMSGFAYREGNRVGHVWIVDGYVDGEVYKCKYSIASNREPILLEKRAVGSCNLVHVNWGWDGLCNGYFLPTCYDTDNGLPYDPDCEYSRNLDFYEKLEVHTLLEQRQ